MATHGTPGVLAAAVREEAPYKYLKSKIEQALM
jgi:hypothetical protein